MTVALGADVSLSDGLTTGATYQGSFGLEDDSRSHALMLRLGTNFKKGAVYVAQDTTEVPRSS